MINNKSVEEVKQVYTLTWAALVVRVAFVIPIVVFLAFFGSLCAEERSEK